MHKNSQTFIKKIKNPPIYYRFLSWKAQMIPFMYAQALFYPKCGSKRETCSLSPVFFQQQEEKARLLFGFDPTFLFHLSSVGVSPQLQPDSLQTERCSMNAVSSTTKRSLRPDPVSFYGGHADKGTAGLMRITQPHL